MFRTMCHAKIHLATVTETRLDYVGSITVDPVFLEMVDLLPYEKVAVVNRNNGYRAETYIIEGRRGSGIIGINGALARHAAIGDRLIVIGYKMIADDKLSRHFEPKVVYLDEHNRICNEPQSALI
ncbi:MAG: aspartate 1-decarboxylase [Planctomycetota bacterium]